MTVCPHDFHLMTFALLGLMSASSEAFLEWHSYIIQIFNDCDFHASSIALVS